MVEFYYYADWDDFYWHIIRLNADGSLDTGFNSGMGTNQILHSLVLQPDGKILVGGESYGWNITPDDIVATTHYVTRFNTDGTLDMTFQIWLDGFVSSTALQSDGKIVIGGAL